MCLAEVKTIQINNKPTNQLPTGHYNRHVLTGFLPNFYLLLNRCLRVSNTVFPFLLSEKQKAMKHILIPTDFSIHSLQPVHDVFAANSGEPVRITLLHPLQMPAGIGDLLLLSRRRKPYELINEAFRDACTILKNKYASQLKELKTEFVYGSTRSLIGNYLEAAGVSAVYMLEQYAYDQGGKQSADITHVFRRLKTPLHYTHAPLAERGNIRPALTDLLPAYDKAVI